MMLDMSPANGGFEALPGEILNLTFSQTKFGDKLWQFTFKPTCFVPAKQRQKDLSQEIRHKKSDQYQISSPYNVSVNQ